MTRFRTSRALRPAAAASVILLGLAAVGGQSGAASPSNPATHEIVAMRRVTEAEYRRAISDIFSPDIKIKGRFEPDVRRDGLIAIGSGQASISSSGMEQYYSMAGGVSDQVLGPQGRKVYVSCRPASDKKPDDKCAAVFLTKYGRMLYRRSLDDKETKGLVKIAHDVASQSGDFYAGLEETLTTMLGSPHFLFRVERSGGAAKDGVLPLDDYSRAERLSYLFWDASPDEALLTAAEHGELSTPDGLKRQVDRLAASPRLVDGMTALFTDMLQFDQFQNNAKDAAVFPKYSQVIATEAREQTLRTLMDLLITKNGDYRDIFTTRDTFMTRNLALVYKVPYTSHDAWAPYTFTADSGRAGIVTQISFLALFGHPAESSPTKRGVALNEIFFCQPIPPPPGNVDFSAVNDGPNKARTMRLRLQAHATNPTCAACHSLVDPLGVSLETFDALGQSRTMEDGVMIDASSQVGSVKFVGGAGLGGVLHDNPRVTSCAVKDLYATGVGHAVGATDRKVVDDLTKVFAAANYRVPAFLKAMASRDDFYVAPVPAKAAPAPIKVAQATPTPSTR